MPKKNESKFEFLRRARRRALQALYQWHLTGQDVVHGLSHRRQEEERHRHDREEHDLDDEEHARLAAGENQTECAVPSEIDEPDGQVDGQCYRRPPRQPFEDLPVLLLFEDPVADDGLDGHHGQPGGNGGEEEEVVHPGGPVEGAELGAAQQEEAAEG